MDVPLPNSDGKLAALVDEVVERGQEVTLTRDGVPAAEIVADAPPPSGREAARRAAEGLLEAGKRLSPRGLSIKEVIEEGRM